MAEYQVQTEVYNGPLDLLLYLIRREEVDLYDIPVARVTEQYLSYVSTLQTIDPNIAGDFLVMAATLMEIKSRMLLPRPPAEEAGDDDLTDPRLELVRQLLEYKKFKDASLELGAAATLQNQKWPRTPARPDGLAPTGIDLEDAQVWDLVAAFNKLMLSIGAGVATHDVVFDDTPISLHAADILDRLQRENRELGFEEVFVGRSKSEMIGLFLAMLELIRQQRIRIAQAGVFGSIRIILLSAEPIEIGDEWEPAIREAVLGSSTEPSASKADERPDTLGGVESDLDDEEETFDELDQIKTEIDIDSVLRGSVDNPPGDNTESN